MNIVHISSQVVDKSIIIKNREDLFNTKLVSDWSQIGKNNLSSQNASIFRLLVSFQKNRRRTWPPHHRLAHYFIGFLWRKPDWEKISWLRSNCSTQTSALCFGIWRWPNLEAVKCFFWSPKPRWTFFCISSFRPPTSTRSGCSIETFISTM